MTSRPPLEPSLRRGPWVNALAYSVIISALLDLFLDLQILPLQLTEGRVTFFLGSIVVVGSVVASVGALAYVESLKKISETFSGFIQGIINMSDKAPELLTMSPKEVAAQLGFPVGADINEMLSYDSWYALWLETRRTSKYVASHERTLMVCVLATSFLGMMLALLETLFPFNIAVVLACFDLIVASLIFFAYLVWMFSLSHFTILDAPAPAMLLLAKRQKKNP